MNRWWVLGARDPEMDAIEELLQELAEPFFYAVHADGTRVAPGTAYNAADFIPRPGGVTSDAVGQPVLVECAVPTWPTLRSAAVCDHHLEGQSGYRAGPKDFLEGSSLGQVIRLVAGDPVELPFPQKEWLGQLPKDFTAGEFSMDAEGKWRVSGISGEETRVGYYALIPLNLVFTAALDHCPAAAYAGHCPGIDPVVIREWWIARRAAELGLPRVAVNERIVRALRKIQTSPRVCVGPDTVVDCRTAEFVPELPEAAAFAGLPILTAPEVRGVRRLMLRHASAEAVTAFLSNPPEPLHQMFGVPARGYAGGLRS